MRGMTSQYDTIGDSVPRLFFVSLLLHLKRSTQNDHKRKLKSALHIPLTSPPSLRPMCPWPLCDLFPLSAPDPASHVPVCASEWGWAWAGARGLHLHVTSGAEQCQWGLGVWYLTGHRAVWTVAGKLRQPRWRVWHLGRPWVSTILHTVKPPKSCVTTT